MFLVSNIIIFGKKIHCYFLLSTTINATTKTTTKQTVIVVVIDIAYLYTIIISTCTTTFKSNQIPDFGSRVHELYILIYYLILTDVFISGLIFVVFHHIYIKYSCKVLMFYSTPFTVGRLEDFAPARPMSVY